MIIPSHSPRPVCLPHQPNWSVKWGCDRNDHSLCFWSWVVALISGFPQGCAFCSWFTLLVRKVRSRTSLIVGPSSHNNPFWVRMPMSISGHCLVFFPSIHSGNGGKIRGCLRVPLCPLCGVLGSRLSSSPDHQKLPLWSLNHSANFPCQECAILDPLSKNRVKGLLISFPQSVLTL